MTDEKEKPKAEEKEEVLEDDGYKIVSVSTAQANAIQSPGGDLMSNDEALVELLNQVKDLRKAIG